MPNNWRLLIYRQLIVLTTLFMVAGAVLAALGLPFFFVASACVVGAALGLFCKDLKLAIFLAMMPLVFWLYANARRAPDSNEISCPNGRFVVIRGVVEESPVLDVGGFSQIVLESDSKIMVRVSGTVKVNMGDTIEAKVLLDKPQNTCQPWDFNRAAYLRKLGVVQSARLLHPDDLRVVKADDDWFYGLKRFVETSRKRLVETHRKYIGDEQGALLTSMVIGDRAVNLPNDLVKQFRDVGLSHVLAASGFNLTIVTGCTLILVRLFSRSTWIGNIACLSAMLSFVILAGPSPSVLRSACMLCVLLFYRTFSRRASISIALAAAIMFAILVDPMCITDVGFQLSYVATATIVFGVGPFRQWLFKSKSYFGLAEAVSVIVLAQMGVLPIQLYYFWCMGLFFLPANLLVSPLVHLVTLSGFASSLLVLLNQSCGLFGGLIWSIDKITAYPLMAILACVKYMASFEQAKLVLGAPHILCLVIYYSAFALFIICVQYGRWQKVSCGVLILAISTLGWHSVPSGTAIALFKNSVAVLSAGGKAVVLGNFNTPALRRFLLYHGAANVEHNDGQKQVFIPELKTLIVRIDESLGDEKSPADSLPETVVFVLQGPRVKGIVDILLSNEQFASYFERCRTVWLVLDRGISKKAELALADRLPSCVKIAKRAGESLVFEASNGSIKIRN